MLTKEQIFDINKYVNLNFVEEIKFSKIAKFKKLNVEDSKKSFKENNKTEFQFNFDMADSAPSLNLAKEHAYKRSLVDVLKELEQTFSETLLRLIDESGMSDVDVYKAAGIDRKLFSKIRSDKNYKPTKNTALALAIALRLNIDKLLDLIGKAGFVLSKSSKFDLIVRYFVENQNYNLILINEALHQFDLPLLCGRGLN